MGAAFVESNLAFAESRVSQMAEVIHEMGSSYLSVGRSMETMFFGFSKQYLLVVCEGERRLALLFPEGPKPLNKTILEVRKFLQERRRVISSFAAIEGMAFEVAPEEAPPPALWSALYPKIKGILVRVVNSGQAQKMIDRILIERAIPEGPVDTMVVEISRQIISQIPHRGKQVALLAELNDLLDDAGLI